MTTAETKEKLLSLETEIKKNILGQDEVIPHVIKCLERGECNLSSPKRPKGSFLFLGPTGVGKTELTLTFTNYFFGEDKLFRFDMSEFMHFDSIKQFIGDERGEYGRLGNVLENNICGTLLFDEMEKAHPQIMDIFLQILDSARITLGNGKTYNLHNYYIVFTSNIGAKRIPEDRVINPETLEKGIKNDLKKVLRKEMIARLGKVCILNQLNTDVQNKIAALLLTKELNRMAEMGYKLTYDDSAFQFIKRYGIEVGLGARPLRDTIEKYTGNAICDILLRGNGIVKGTLVEDRERQCLKII